MEHIAADMQLDASQVEFEGRGFVHSDDVVNAGFIQGETSHVAVQVIYDELALLDDYDGVDVTRMTRELSPVNPLALNLMRITVDGEPIDDLKRSSSDIQRCTDVALAKADIQFGFDNLRSVPRLSVLAQPERIAVVALKDGDTYASEVEFRMYTNYSHFVNRAEIRVFEPSQSLKSEPLDVFDIKADGTATWRPATGSFRAPAKKLAYVLRVYGDDGNFDETEPQALWIDYDNEFPLEEIELSDSVEDPDEVYNLADAQPDIVDALTHRMERWIAAREQETGLKDPILTQGDWHGHDGVGAFKSSQQAYDTLHIGDPTQARRLQEKASG